jgi:hypothetical protein
VRIDADDGKDNARSQQKQDEDRNPLRDAFKCCCLLLPIFCAHRPEYWYPLVRMKRSTGQSSTDEPALR